VPALARPPSMPTAVPRGTRRSHDPTRFPPPRTGADWRESLAASFDERDLVDFAQRRNSSQHPLDSRLAQRPHAFFAGGLLHFGCGTAREDDLTNVIGQIQQLADGRAALVARAATFDAARAFEKQAAVREPRIHRRFNQLLARDVRRALAVEADVPHEPLRQDAVVRGYEMVRHDAND